MIAFANSLESQNALASPVIPPPRTAMFLEEDGTGSSVDSGVVGNECADLAGTKPFSSMLDLES